MSGNNITLTKLSTLLKDIDSKAQEQHSWALSNYPQQKYQTHDQNSVSLQQAKIFVAKLLTIHEVESGYTDCSMTIGYLEHRRAELEQFYLQATAQDKQALLAAINSITAEILDNKIKKESIKNKELVVDFPADIQLTLTNFELI